MAIKKKIKKAVKKATKTKTKRRKRNVTKKVSFGRRLGGTVAEAGASTTMGLMMGGLRSYFGDTVAAVVNTSVGFIAGGVSVATQPTSLASKTAKVVLHTASGIAGDRIGEGLADAMQGKVEEETVATEADRFSTLELNSGREQAENLNPTASAYADNEPAVVVNNSTEIQ